MTLISLKEIGSARCSRDMFTWRFNLCLVETIGFNKICRGEYHTQKQA